MTSLSDSISVIAGASSVVAGTGALVYLIRKFFQSMHAEMALKLYLQHEKKQYLTNEFTAFQSGKRDASMAELKVLTERLDHLVTESKITEDQKNVLLLGLRQPSDVGKVQYARKLYESVAAN
jgi:hypothetical protein